MVVLAKVIVLNIALSNISLDPPAITTPPSTLLLYEMFAFNNRFTVNVKVLLL